MRLEFDAGDIERWERALDDAGKKHLRFAAARSLTEVARDATVELRDDAHKKLDRPVPFTAREGARGKAADAFTIRPAKKDDAEPFSEVIVKDRQAEYMELLIEGGTRRPGDIGTTGQMGAAIPVRQRTNKYGNLARSRGRLKLLEKAEQEDSRLFVGQPKGYPDAPFGIYERPKRRSRQGKLKLMVAFKRITRYRPQFSFQLPVSRAVEGTNLKDYFARFLEEAFATAKRGRSGQK